MRIDGLMGFNHVPVTQLRAEADQSYALRASASNLEFSLVKNGLLTSRPEVPVAPRRLDGKTHRAEPIGGSKLPFVVKDGKAITGRAMPEAGVPTDLRPYIGMPTEQIQELDVTQRAIAMLANMPPTE